MRGCAFTGFLAGVSSATTLPIQASAATAPTTARDRVGVRMGGLHGVLPLDAALAAAARVVARAAAPRARAAPEPAPAPGRRPPRGERASVQVQDGRDFFRDRVD